LINQFEDTGIRSN